MFRFRDSTIPLRKKTPILLIGKKKTCIRVHADTEYNCHYFYHTHKNAMNWKAGFIFFLLVTTNEGALD